MNGTETKDEIERGRLWDYLYTDGQPKTAGELAMQTGSSKSTVARLTSHEWFKCEKGRLRIAMSRATTKTALVCK